MKDDRTLRWQAGFTLLELLVALCILSLLASLAAGVLNLGSRVWERTSERLEAVDDSYGTQAFLRRILERIYPAWINDVDHRHIDFDGNRESIIFLEALPSILAPSGYSRTSLTVDGDTGERRVILSLQDLSGHSFQQLVLLTHLQDLAFSYYGRDTTGDADEKSRARWHSEWRNEQRLPGLIKISVVFPPGDLRHWPDLTVAPRIDVDALCLPDPISHGCEGR